MRNYIGLVILVGSFSLGTNTYADTNNRELVEAIKELCMAPSSEKSSHYKVTANGETSLRVKLLAFLGGDFNFTREQWDGARVVMKEHQAGDLQNYRSCVQKMIPYFKEPPKAEVVTKDKPKEIDLEISPKPEIKTAKQNEAKPPKDTHLETNQNPKVSGNIDEIDKKTSIVITNKTGVNLEVVGEDNEVNGITIGNISVK
jgi:hypothetical protein